MSKRSPAFQYYPDRMAFDTDHLSDLGFRSYHRILYWMWKRSPDYCTMENTKGQWRKALGISSSKTVDAVYDELMDPECQMFEVADNRIKSIVLEEERKKQQKYIERAKKGAEARWKDHKKNA